MILNEQARAGEEEVSKGKAAQLEAAGTHDIRQENGKFYAKKKTSSGGNNTNTGTKLPDTPFKNQAEGDAFRKWVHENEKEWATYNKLSESHSSYNSEIMKKAWKEFGDRYKQSQSSGGTPPPNNSNQGGQNVSNLKFNCNDKWEGNDNYFIRDFSVKAPDAARDFMFWYANLYPSQFVDGGVYYGQCGVTSSPPYIQGNDIHTNPVLKHIATRRIPYRKTKNDQVKSVETYEAFLNQYNKGSNNNQNADNRQDSGDQQVKSTELQILFTKGQGIKSILNRNEKPTRKACKDLIQFYNNAYDIAYSEKQPSGYSREEFKKRMNDTKFSIFYCMKGHPGLSLDTEINKFSNVTDKDWYISLQNYASNIIKEEKNMNNNIKSTLRQRLVETKLVKSLKTEIHAKALDGIADDFYSRKYNKFFTKIFEHTKSLQNSRGVISEEVTDTFQKAFNTLFYGNETKMKEQTINHILKELKVDPNSEIGVEITNELNNIPDSEVTKLLSDPTFVADKITSAIDKTVTHQDVDDDSLENMLRASTVNKLKSTMDDIKFKVANRITGVLDNARQNVEKTSDELKQSFIEKLSNKIVGI